MAPDWSADWLHREAVFLLDKLALESENMRYNDLPDEKKAYLKVMLQKDQRKNNYDPETGILTVSDNRAEAIASNSDYYGKLFTDDPSFKDLREYYSIQENALKDPERVRLLNAFFF